MCVAAYRYVVERFVVVPCRVDGLGVFFLYRNLISWLMRNLMVWAAVFLSRCSCPLVLMEMYLGCSCFSLHILLNHMAAFVFSNLSLVFL